MAHTSGYEPGSLSALVLTSEEFQIYAQVTQKSSGLLDDSALRRLRVVSWLKFSSGTGDDIPSNFKALLTG